MLNQLTKISFILTLILCLSTPYIDGKVTKGKTYDDLAEMLNNANKKIADEQDKQAVHSSVLAKQQKNIQSNNEDDVEDKKKANSQSSNPKTPTSSLATPDNYKPHESIIHSHKNDKKDDGLAQELHKKKLHEDKEGIKLRSVTIPRRTSENERLYFFLSTLILLLTCAIIIGACFGLVYFMYKSVFEREEYF